MSQGIYSERFIVASGAGVHSWQVPQWKRAVVKMVAAVNGTTVAQNVALIVAGVYVWVQTISPNSGVTATGLHVVYYGLDSMQLYFTATGCSGMAGGFLFDDPPPSVQLEESVPTAGPPEIIEEPWTGTIASESSFAPG